MMIKFSKNFEGFFHNLVIQMFPFDVMNLNDQESNIQDLLCRVIIIKIIHNQNNQ